MTLSPIEQQIRQQLGVPDDARRVLIFAQSAHMDWDWLNVFPYNVTGSGSTVCDPSYFNFDPAESAQPSDKILQQAYNLIASSSDYWWSICEIGFLQGFAENPSYASYFQRMVLSGRLAAVGGGITSPDNLIPNGEAFLRDFLVAYEWLTARGLPWTEQVWLPDDFGHDSQLPVMLAALGASGVGFARIPGACDQHAPNVGDTAKTLLGQVSGQPGGADFTWRAADGSTVFAHWLPNHYGQGNTIDGSGYVYTEDSELARCSGQAGQQFLSTPSQHINGYISLNCPVSPTPYILVDVGGDFSLPIGGAYPGTTPPPKEQLSYYADQWNTECGPLSYEATGVWVVVATFDHYARLAQAYAEANPGTLLVRDFHATDGDQPFVSNPYWMGFYASRPRLKILHDQATRALLAAETWGELDLLSGGKYDAATVDAGWNQLAPSTHHDYVTGTSLTCVYTNEQLPLLEKALASGETVRDASLLDLAGKVAVGTPSAVTFNPLGFPRTGLALLPTDYEVAPPPSGAPALQQSSDGGWLAYGEAGPFGYAASPMSQAPPSGAPTASQDGAGNVTVANGSLRAVISAADGTLSSFQDLAAGGAEVFAGSANTLAFLPDPSGNVYQFGYEMQQSLDFATVDAQCLGLSIVENGPLRVLVKAQVQVTSQSPSINETYDVVYSLVLGEAFLRVSVTGAAPANTSVLAAFPFASDVEQLLHGTAYHWDVKQVAPFDSVSSGFHPTFESVHDFVVPVSSDNAQAAIYPASCRAWAGDGKTLYGCILRNSLTVTWVTYEQSDPDPHTIEYAIRVPSGLPTAVSGDLLREARGYAVPLVAASVAAQSGSLPASRELVGITAPGGDPTPAMVTAAKQGSFDESALVLRLYQPTNAPLDVALDLSTLVNVQPGWIWQAAPATALEQPIAGAQGYRLDPDGQVLVTLERAVTTLIVSRIG